MKTWNRAVLWRQGSALPEEALDPLGLRVHGEDSIGLVVSHDCDLAQAPELEPKVEVIVGRFIENADGNCVHAKNARRLHLKAEVEGGTRSLELNANGKTLVPKIGQGGLFQFEPSPSFQIATGDLVTLQHWLAARYRRAAFPEEFDRRLGATKLKSMVLDALKQYGQSITAVFFDLDEGQCVERTGPDDLYTLGIIVVYPTDQDPCLAEAEATAAARTIASAFRSRCHSGARWQWIELVECMPIADEALTYAQTRYLKKWNADAISLREDPPGAILD